MRYFLLTALLILTVTVLTQKDYTGLVQFFQDTIKNDESHKHSAYNRLAYISDTYGPRMWGSTVLEQVIQEMFKQAKAQNFENVHLQPVSNFTKWVRGKQSLTLISPRPTPSKLDVIGLGQSIGGDVQGEVIVVKDFDELEKVKDKVKGKIVCFNNPWEDYYKSYEYRVYGGSKVAKYGATAMLVRSLASESIYSVHTGFMQYDPQYPKIPCAAITVEDANMFSRMQARGQKIVVHLVMNNQFIQNSNSNNLIFEIKGSTYPDQVILAGGHIDTWDTGSQTGANDDGGGFITVFEALRLIYRNGFRPKRTLRFIAWSGEESGSAVDGAAQYLSRHSNELSKHVAAFESDLGSTQLLGFGLSGGNETIFKDVLSKYLSIINAGNYLNDGLSPDVEPLNDNGVPAIKNLIKDTPDHNYYFKYHHSAGDSMSIMNPDEMDSNVLGIASLLYILADLDVTIRNI